jgi:hypothetical protein
MRQGGKYNAEYLKGAGGGEYLSAENKGSWMIVKLRQLNCEC